MKKNKIYLIGSGGHAASCIDVLETSKKFKIAGIFSDDNKNFFLNYKILGNINSLLKKNKKLNLHIAIGSIKNYNFRRKLFLKLQKKGHHFPCIVSNQSIVSKRAKIGDGTIIFHSSIINTNAEIGKNCIINTSSCIEHDVRISDHAHISTCAVINGNCKIGMGTFVGSSTVLKENIEIGSKSIIGFGKSINKNIPSGKLIK